MTGEKLKLQCDHCGNLTILKVRGKYRYKEELATNLDHIEEWYMMECLTCSQPTLKQHIRIVSYHPEVYNEYIQEKEWEEEIEEVKTQTLYPTNTNIPRSTTDMPAEIAEIFNEARSIFNGSPRASAALLRLAIEKLCKHLGQPDKNLNQNIAALVEKGLPDKIQQSLDIIRVIGNNAVHAGKIDIRDDQETVLTLFKIINFIVEETITRPREIEEIYAKLPETQIEQIKKRAAVLKNNK